MNCRSDAGPLPVPGLAFGGVLTAKWRDKNKALVVSEVAEQKRILAENGGVG